MHLLFFIFAFALITNDSVQVSRDYETYLRHGGEHLMLDRDSRRLFWFNAVHSNDPTNPMFAEIKSEFIKYAPDFVLVEGAANLNEFKNEAEAMLSGESCYVSHLCKVNRITVEDIEPPDSVFYQKMLDDYSIEDILAFMIVRQLAQWQREFDNREMNIPDMSVRYARHVINSGLEWEGDPPDYEEIGRLLKTRIDGDIDYSNWHLINARDIVYQRDCLIHSAWKKAIEIRDNYVFERIASATEHHDRVFVMMGFDHARHLMPRLRELFK
ncbi:MAG: hypothetical protein ACLFQX_09960 [Candidatus Kapaibacterium sp.]